MRNVVLLLFVGLMIPFLFSCSTTPGDASYRAGQYQHAANMYRSLAGRGDGLAAFKLARMYDGTNWEPALPRDESEAIVWYERAFALDQKQAPYFIGKIYAEGDGNVARDISKAKEWFEKTAQLGHHYSMYELAGLYAKKLIHPPNDVEGLMWAEAVREMARRHPSNEGTKAILDDRLGYWKLLRDRMGKFEIKEAEDKASELLNSYQEH